MGKSPHSTINQHPNLINPLKSMGFNEAFRCCNHGSTVKPQIISNHHFWSMLVNQFKPPFYMVSSVSSTIFHRLNMVQVQPPFFHGEKPVKPPFFIGKSNETTIFHGKTPPFSHGKSHVHGRATTRFGSCSERPRRRRPPPTRSGEFGAGRGTATSGARTKGGEGSPGAWHFFEGDDATWIM